MIKDIAQIMPLAITVKETPKTCERVPAIKLPKGIKPAKVNINTLITLPRNSSPTTVCRIVLMMAIAVTEPQPINIKAIIDKK
jgi:hypothetical protein